VSSTHEISDVAAPVSGRLLYSVPEVSDLLRICQTNVYGFLRSGELRSVKIGARRLVPAEALTSFVNGLQDG
jgi:excisionase family DNA binding protein